VVAAEGQVLIIAQKVVGREKADIFTVKVEGLNRGQRAQKKERTRERAYNTQPDRRGRNDGVGKEKPVHLKPLKKDTTKKK